MRFRTKPTPGPLPMSPYDLLVEGQRILSEVAAGIEDNIVDLHNAIHCLEESSFGAAAEVFRAQQLITALRVVQAL